MNVIESNKNRKGEIRKDSFILNKHYNNVLLKLLKCDEFTYKDIEKYITRTIWANRLKEILLDSKIILETKEWKNRQKVFKVNDNMFKRLKQIRLNEIKSIIVKTRDRELEILKKLSDKYFKKQKYQRIEYQLDNKFPNNDFQSIHNYMDKKSYEIYIMTPKHIKDILARHPDKPTGIYYYLQLRNLKLNFESIKQVLESKKINLAKYKISMNKKEIENLYLDEFYDFIFTC